MPHHAHAEPVTVDRREGPYGEVALRKRGGTYEIIANGMFLMDTSDGRSERLLVDAALDAVTAHREPPPQEAPQDHPGLSLLLGGLGVGFSLARAAGSPAWATIDVVEREPAVVEWHREGRLAAFSEHALEDPRVRTVERDLVTYIREATVTYDAICLDIDNGPDWTVTENNGSLYNLSGLTACRERLTPGGVLAVWSAQPSAAFEAELRAAGFSHVRTLEVPVARGVPDAVHLATRA